jgi:alpha-beta hydrolase superfamily lysophospholipase
MTTTRAGDIDRIVRSREGRPQPDVVFRAWRAAAPEAALIIVHGLGGHSDRYQECAGRWSGRGISCYAPDLPGFGHADGPKGDLDSFAVVTGVLEALLARVVAENSRRPVFLLGESMGGVVLADFVAGHPGLASGLVLVAPSFQDRLNVPLWKKAEAFLNVLVRRRKYYDVPWTPESFTRDPAVIDMLNADPLEVRRVTGQFYYAYLPVAKRAREAAPRLPLPLLVLLPGNDLMIDSNVTRDWFDLVPDGRKTLREYPGYYHALLLERDRGPILDDVADWILAEARPDGSRGSAPTAG